MSCLVENKDCFLIFDGAMGTMLQRAGLKTGELPEVYNIEKPSLIREIHKEYIEAGADIITTNTFQTNEWKLMGSPYSVEEVIEAGVKIAKESGGKWVALDIGPIGKMMQPLGEVSFQQAYEIFQRQVICGARAGADLILIETFSDLYEAKAAVLAAKENSQLPVFCTITFQKDGKTFLGTDPKTAVIVLQSLGVDCLGINCSLGPKEMLPILREIVEFAKVPVMVQSNAGLPVVVGDETVFPVGPEDFGKYTEEMARLGAQVIGGCCGTTPHHIRAIKKALEGKKPVRKTSPRVTCCSSGTQTVILDGKTTVIGERINPTGKKKIKEALLKNQMEVLLAEAVEQINHGAEILDVNVGLPEIDEKTTLPKVISKIQGIVEVPLQLDSVNAEALEAAARLYNGKPIINSVNGKEKVMEEIFPIVKKYGACVIGLTLDEKGIPETAEERLVIARKIIEKALRYGIPKEDILIDCLVLTASAQQSMVKETIKALHLIKRELGVQTVLGVSNVSYGLPNRPLLNRTFLAGALAVGLDAAITDPLSEEIQHTIDAFRVLNDEDREARKYIERFGNLEKVEIIKSLSEKSIEELIREGRKKEIAEKVEGLLKTHSPLEIVNQYFIPTLDDIGKGYEEGRFFLPHLLRGAEAVKCGVEVIKKYALQEVQSIEKGKIVLATVKGDIHDIGKSIVKILLENYGFNVIDLGKDVDAEVIADEVRRHSIKLVGLSALMTTTVKNMAFIIEVLRKEVPECKIMVGGAVLNPRYAKMIGADYYAVDAQAGVKIAVDVFKGI